MSIRASRGSALFDRRSGFVFMELLVVVGIISTIVALLLPALSTVRAQSRMVVCQSNVRQLLTAVNAYAVSYGQYPPNYTIPAPAASWFDQARLGQFVSCTTANGGSLVGSIMVCPADEGAMRSYAMNTWASSMVDVSVKRYAPGHGAFWSIAASDRSRLILIAEKWPANSKLNGGWVTQEPFGIAGSTPGERFGVNGGIAPPLSGVYVENGWPINSELPFVRHRPANSRGTGMQPIGRVTIGYADGHVEMKSNDDLADAATGLSTLDSLWSPLDPSINH